MSYFTEVFDYQTYGNEKADFRFSYNANSGGGQSFLGGRFINEKGELTSPTVLDGCIGVFNCIYKNENDQGISILMNDEKGRYEIKPRGEGSSSMKLGIGTKMENPNKLISSLFMLPPVCNINSSGNLNNSIITSNNLWLQSMWLNCYFDNTKEKEVYLIPKDFIYCGGISKEQKGKARYFKLDAQKRITDILYISKNLEFLPKSLWEHIKTFADIYKGEQPFNYDKCIEATNQIMVFLAQEYPTKYSGIEDPLPFLLSLTKTTKQYKKIDPIYFSQFIKAIRTKPFLLLAGISGTGKSRKVQELAYLTCKRDGIHDVDPTTPGNYLLIPVKPNWHDSTELLGYYSSITGKYVLTDFIRFVWKAWKNKKVPYFLCLDEMNLAPVEQYFAEYLSILETRKLIRNEKTGEWEIQSAELLSKKIFENIDTYKKISIDNKDDDGVRSKEEPMYKGEDIQIINFLKENGLGLPENLFVIGTVNMDDTTHQFSRKVIDRAFTIEMNGDELKSMFDTAETLVYQDEPLTLNEIRPLYVQAREVLAALPDDSETIKDEVPKMLNKINGEGIFNDTPFRVSYRVQNELVLYYAAIRPQGVLNQEQIKPYLVEAFMAVLLEKVLPRVEGDEKALRCKEDGYSEILNNLKKYICELNPDEAVRSEICKTLIAKLNEMNERVKNSYFTSFFS